MREERLCGKASIFFIMSSLWRSSARFVIRCDQAHFSSRISKFDPNTETMKKKMLPWKFSKDHQERKSFFGSFFGSSTTDLLKFLSTPIDFRGPKISSWWKKKLYMHELSVQTLDEHRLASLGSAISAGYAFLALGAGVLYRGKPWMKNQVGKVDQPELPDEYQDGWLLEAVDLSGCPIHYEGFCHFRNLDSVHTLTAQKCPYIDDWCLDLIGSELLGLEVLDISNCEKVSPRGLGALVRLPNLHTLDLSDCPAFKTDEGLLMCVLLQDYNPNLTIKGIELPNVSEVNQTNVNYSMKDIKS